MPPGEDLFQYGMLRGAKHATEGLDYSQAMNKQPGLVPWYGFGGADGDLSTMGTDLVERMNDAPPHLAKLYYKAFLAGYELGHELNLPRERLIGLLSLDHLLRIGGALRSYALEGSGKMPRMDSLASLQHSLVPVGMGVRNDDFLDPFAKRPYQFNAALAGKKWLGLKSHAPKTVFAYEGQVAPDGTRGVLFVTGEARRVPGAEWERLQKQPGIQSSSRTRG